MKEMYQITSNKKLVELNEVKKVYVVEVKDKDKIFDSKNEAIFFENFNLTFEEFFDKFNIQNSIEILGSTLSIPTYLKNKSWKTLSLNTTDEIYFKLYYHSHNFGIFFKILKNEKTNEIKIILDLEQMKNDFLYKEAKKIRRFYNSNEVTYEEFLKLQTLYSFQQKP